MSRNLFVILVLLTFSGTSQDVLAINIDIHGTTISIPAPAGFTEVQAVSMETFQAFEDLCPPANRLLACFLTNQDAGSLMKGEDAELNRHFLVQVYKQLEPVNVSLADFSPFREGIRTEFENYYAENREKVDAWAKRGSDNLSRRYDTDVKLDIEGMVPLGINEETASHISTSMLIKYESAILESVESYISAGTMVIQLVRGKVLFLYVYRNYNSNSDLEWTKKVAKEWSNRIIAANEATAGALGSEIVHPSTTLKSGIKELISGPRTTYSTAGHTKALGLDITVEYPASWESKEGVRPHIVQNFNGGISGNIMPGFLLLIQKIPGWAATYMDEETLEEVLAELKSESIPENATYLDGGDTRIDGEPAIWLKYAMEQERAGNKLQMYFLSFTTIYRGKMISIQCNVGSTISDKLIIEDAFQSHLPVFQNIANSLVIQNKWEDPATGDSDGFWLLELLLSGLITWGIGLAPPIITRYAILKRSMAKNATIGFCISFLLINIIVFTALGSTSKTHVALFLVALASFAILRKGASEDDLERERIRAEAEKQKQERDRQQWEEQARRAREDARRKEEDHKREKRGKEQQRKREESEERWGVKDEKYYARILGLSGKVTTEEVKKRYRDLAAKYHPDRVNHLGKKLQETAEREMKSINEAYDFFRKRYNM